MDQPTFILQPVIGSKKTGASSMNLQGLHAGSFGLGGSKTTTVAFEDWGSQQNQGWTWPHTIHSMYGIYLPIFTIKSQPNVGRY